MNDKYIDYFYVIPDLGVQGSLEVRKFDTVEKAVAEYNALPKDKPKALGITNTDIRTGSLDFVQCKDGVNLLQRDHKRLPSWDNREVYQAVEYMKENIELVERLDIRFITPEYDTLFYLPDGEAITRHYPDGSTRDAICHACPDGYHFRLGYNTFHICEFAELCRKQGITIEPKKPLPGVELNTYEIYQVRNLDNCDYAFRSYAEAGSKLNAKHYCFVYAGMLGESLQLENLYRLHNLDDRPLPYGMHALSVSDIVIRNEKGNSTAYYVDDFGFKEIPGFAGRLKEERIRQGVKICHER